MVDVKCYSYKWHLWYNAQLEVLIEIFLPVILWVICCNSISNLLWFNIHVVCVLQFKISYEVIIDNYINIMQNKFLLKKKLSIHCFCSASLPLCRIATYSLLIHASENCLICFSGGNKTNSHHGCHFRNAELRTNTELKGLPVTKRWHLMF